MRTVTILMFFVFVTAATGAEIYRYIDADGNVVYSDKPLGADVVTLVIDTSTATPPSVPSEPNSPQAAESQPVPEPKQDPGPTAEEIVAQRSENCRIARGRQERYNAVHRIYRGTIEEREYLTDDEIDEIRMRAGADVEEWCD